MYRCILYTVHCTLYTVHWTLDTGHCTLHTTSSLQVECPVGVSIITDEGRLLGDIVKVDDRWAIDY